MREHIKSPAWALRSTCRQSFSGTPDGGFELGPGEKLRKTGASPRKAMCWIVALTTHRCGFHHVGLRKHYRPTDGSVHHSVIRNGFIFIINVGDFLVHNFAKGLRAALRAWVESTRLPCGKASEHDPLSFVSNHLHRDSFSTGQNFSNHLGLHAGNHFGYQCALRAARGGQFGGGHE